MTNLKYNKRNILISILRSTSGIIAVVCIIMALKKHNIIYPFWILPFAYSLMLFFARHNVIMSAPGIITLNVVMFFRYVITPVIIYVTEELSIFANNYNYLTNAVWLMLYELIVVMITIELTGRKQERKIRNEISRESESFHHFRGNTILTLFIIGIIVFLASNYRYLTSGMSLIITGESSIASESVADVSGVVGILWQGTLAWMYIYTCLMIKKNSKRIGLSILVSAFYILMTFIGQTSISRWYTVISCVAVFFTMIKLYPEKKKFITFSILIPVCILIIIVSIYKNTSFLSTGGSSLSSFFMNLFNVTTFDSYFAGPVNVNSAIGLSRSKNMSVFTIFYDLVNNMPIVNGFVDIRNASVNMFNMYIGRAFNGITGDQIIPLIGQSMSYFTIVLAPLLSVISVVLTRYFDRKYLICKTPMMYAFAFSGAWLGVATILNLTICINWFYIRIIPLMLLIKATESLGNNKNEELMNVRSTEQLEDI